MQTYEGLIAVLAPNEIFVFGSNTQGRHGKGAALWARKNAGAIYGVSNGLQGRSYAIITKDLTRDINPSISVDFITFQIGELYKLAELNPNLRFMIAYSGSGTNLNGYSNQQMADMFSSMPIPDNIVFEKEFATLLSNL